MDAPKFNVVKNGKRYDTSKAEMIANDLYWDGHNFERHGRNRFLYKTPNGAYFTTTATMWQGERDSLEVLSETEARALYEQLPEHYVSYQVAFPNAVIVDA